MSQNRQGEVVISPDPVKRKLTPMTRSTQILIAAISAIFATACQPAEVIEDAPAPPPASVAENTETVVAEGPAPEAPAAPEGHDHDDEGHAETGHQDEEGHDHADKEHSDHDHDEAEHDHAGGEAHVHGHGDLAVSLSETTIAVSLEAPLANFGLNESDTEIENSSLYTDSLVTLVGGDACTRSEASVMARSNGDHGNMAIDLLYACPDVKAVTAIDVTVFSAFSGFEDIDAVVLTDAGQSASELTPDAARLTLN